MNLLERRASDFARTAHEAVGQRRKYTGDPYIVHPAAVAAIVRSVPHDEAMLAAAWLHDTVEDTNVLLSEILIEFGADVAELVEMLTNVSKSSDGNRSVRTEIDRAHTSQASARAKTIKLADLINNSESILTRDRHFASTYLREKAALLVVLKEGNSELWARANSIVIAGLAEVSLPTAG